MKSGSKTKKATDIICLYYLRKSVGRGWRAEVSSASTEAFLKAFVHLFGKGPKRPLLN